MAKHTTHLLLQTLPGSTIELGIAWGAPRWQPRVDIYETQDTILIQIEAAGLNEQNLRLHYEPGQLVIEGWRERPALPCPTRCLQVEIDYGPFARSLPLPPDADGRSIEASYQAGMLLITVPRQKPVEPQSVRVNVE